jgi:hypothetical protein
VRLRAQKYALPRDQDGIRAPVHCTLYTIAQQTQIEELQRKVDALSKLATALAAVICVTACDSERQSPPFFESVDTRPSSTGDRVQIDRG